jgi:hypothetical protein
VNSPHSVDCGRFGGWSASEQGQFFGSDYFARIHKVTGHATLCADIRCPPLKIMPTAINTLTANFRDDNPAPDFNEVTSFSL